MNPKFHAEDKQPSVRHVCKMVPQSIRHHESRKVYNLTEKKPNHTWEFFPTEEHIHQKFPHE